MLATLANIDSNFSNLFSHARQYTHSNILLSSTHFTSLFMYSIVIYSLKKLSPLSEVNPMEPREIKGLEIAAKSKVIRKGESNLWLVPSQAGREEKYTVALHDEKPECTCRDFEFRATKCKHIFAVEYTIQRKQTADGATITTETLKVTRKTYSQNWPAYNAAQTEEKSRLQALLYELCKAIPEPEQRRGRPRLSLADIIFASTFKIYSTVSGRRFQSDLQEAKRRGFLSQMPSYNSVFRYLEAEALTPYLYELITASAFAA